MHLHVHVQCMCKYNVHVHVHYTITCLYSLTTGWSEDWDLEKNLATLFLSSAGKKSEE